MGRFRKIIGLAHKHWVTTVSTTDTGSIIRTQCVDKWAEPVGEAKQILNHKNRDPVLITGPQCIWIICLSSNAVHHNNVLFAALTET